MGVWLSAREGFGSCHVKRSGYVEVVKKSSFVFTAWKEIYGTLNV